MRRRRRRAREGRKRTKQQSEKEREGSGGLLSRRQTFFWILRRVFDFAADLFLDFTKGFFQFG